MEDTHAICCVWRGVPMVSPTDRHPRKNLRPLRTTTQTHQTSSTHATRHIRSERRDHVRRGHVTAEDVRVLPASRVQGTDGRESPPPGSAGEEGHATVARSEDSRGEPGSEPGLPGMSRGTDQVWSECAGRAGRAGDPEEVKRVRVPSNKNKKKPSGFFGRPRSRPGLNCGPAAGRRPDPGPKTRPARCGERGADPCRGRTAHIR